MDLAAATLATLAATVRDVAPIVVVLIVFQVFVLRRRPPNPRRILVGSLYVLLGLGLFLVGLEEALFPIGRTMATQLTAPRFTGAEAVADPQWTDYLWVYAFAFAVGFAATIAEPALIAVAMKARAVSGGAIGVLGLRLAVAFGVATGVALGTFRIVTGTPLPYYIMAGYLVVMVQTWRAPRAIVPLAYDSGGVSTSTVTVPVVTAIGLGLASSIPGRTALVDGFGLIAFACVFPIMSVLGYASLIAWLSGRRSRAGKERPQ
ncbi:MAG: DUF1538 family protein [Rhodospirillales bacterium]